MLDCSRGVSTSQIGAEDGDSETESEFRLADSSDDPPHAVKLECEDGPELGEFNEPGVPDTDKAPCPLIDEVVPDAETASYHATLPPSTTADWTLPHYNAYGDVSVAPSGPLPYDHLSVQEVGCLCAEVGCADSAAMVLALAAEDNVSAVRCLPADLSVDRRCEILARLRMLNTYMRCAILCHYSVGVEVV